jgi:hypothetical protein
LDETMAIGCQSHTLSAWAAFTSSEIAAMESGAVKFWAENKDKLLSAARDGGRVFDWQQEVAA